MISFFGMKPVQAMWFVNHTSMAGQGLARIFTIITMPNPPPSFFQILSHVTFSETCYMQIPVRHRSPLSIFVWFLTMYARVLLELL